MEQGGGPLNAVQKARLALAVLSTLRGSRPRPIAVAWLVTGRCAGRCEYCRWRSLRDMPELDSSAAHRMIDQMADAGVCMVSFTGGEPLLRDDIGELVDHVAARGMVCKLNTNGQLLTRSVDKLRRLDLLQVSLDGPPAVHDRLRGAGTSSQAASAIALARRSGIPVQAVACLTRDVVRHLDEVLEQARELRVKLLVQPLAPPSSLEKDDFDAAPAPAELRAALERLHRLRRGRGPMRRAIGTTAGELDHYIEVARGVHTGCHCALVTATMLPDGGLIFCGNARDQDPIDAVRLGFARAFARLTIPECDGCTCVGKLRISRVARLDPSVLLEVIRL